MELGMKRIMLSMNVLCVWSTEIVSYNKLHVKALAASGSLATPINTNFSRCDFRGAQALLQGIKCSGFNFNGANFSMYGASDDQSILVHGNIRNFNVKTDLTGSDFSNTSCVSANFENTILKNVKFTNADLSGANFTNADLTGADFTGVVNTLRTVFCGATMPDGSVCSGSSWQNLSCNCAQ